MTLIEMYSLLKAIYNEKKEHYNYLGIRFENKDREIGDICEKSRHNQNRIDDREFPEYNSDEFKNLIVLNGTSAWELENFIKSSYKEVDGNIDCQRYYFTTEHCYIITGNYINNHDDADDGEIVIEDAIVIAKIF